jgi:predicted AlkP superfamily phosphohydrolase/phosphomutase
MHLTDESEDPLTAGSGNPHIHRIMQKIDASIGRQLDALGPETSVMIYSTHGMGLNGWDINSMYILPECLHRDAFPERRKQDRSPLPPASLGNWWWADSVWKLTFGNSRAKPRMDEGINYIPATWYARDWPLMRAFALPGFDEGMVRVNVAGRDPHGIVPPDDYEAELIRLRELLSGLTDERTGEPLVTGFFRTRKHALDDSDALPPADLIVEWTCKPCDVAYSPKVGRIGPVPLRRTGGHTRNGFAWFSGPQFVPGEKSPATPYDLGPTLLDMLGFPMPNHFSGQSLLRNAGSSVNPAMFQRL